MGERFIARVVSTFKITIPAEIRELRNVEVGDFVELELLRVIKRGRGPRPAPSQRYVGSSRSPRKPGHEAPRWEGAGKSRMGVKASNALAGQNGGREAPADEGLSSGARQECPRGACAEQSPLEKLAGKCYIKQSPTGICFGRERRSGPQNAERSQGSTCFGRELAANSKPQSPRGAKRLTAREARQEQPVLACDGGSEEPRKDPNLGRYPWCGAPLPGWQECPAREACLKGELDYCEYPEREYEYKGERSLEPEWLYDGGEPDWAEILVKDETEAYCRKLNELEGAREAPGGSAQAGAERAQPVVGTGPHGLPGAQERGKTRRKLDLELFYEVMP